jgi:hypothetical protein
MDFHQFNKEHYFFEVNRRHQLTSALTIPIGVLTVLGGALLVIAKNLEAPLGILEVIQFLLIVVSAISMGVTIFFLIKSYFNYSYGYIATPKELKEHFEALVAYYSDINGSRQDAEKELEEYINSEYAEHTHRNTQNNDTKSSYLHKANGFLITSLVFVILAGLPYVAISIMNGSKVQKIEIINTQQTQIGDQTMTEEKKHETTEQKIPPQQPLKKPSSPPGRLVKESVDPKKTK